MSIVTAVLVDSHETKTCPEPELKAMEMERGEELPELMESGISTATTFDSDSDSDSSVLLPPSQHSLDKDKKNRDSTTGANTSSNNNPDHDAWKLLFGAAGIYLAYLSYGSLQEDLFSFQSPQDGGKFRYAWFLQVLESCVNICVGIIGRWVFGGTKGLPLLPFATSGASQVFAKVFTSLSLAAGLSFPVCILAKSAKMVPVMLGQLAIGGSSYTMRDYCIAAAIVGGTALLTLGESKGGDSSGGSDKGGGNSSNNTTIGIAFILVSLVMDGVTAGLQKRLKQDALAAGKVPTPYDFLLYTNLSMASVALTIALASNDWKHGWEFVSQNPEILRMIMLCCGCSAVGQSFIFYVVANFDPLVCSTVTTTRKIMSVVWSITTKGHVLSEQGSLGLLVAVSALLLEVQGKFSFRQQRRHQPKTFA